MRNSTMMMSPVVDASVKMWTRQMTRPVGLDIGYPTLGEFGGVRL